MVYGIGLTSLFWVHIPVPWNPWSNLHVWWYSSNFLGAIPTWWYAYVYIYIYTIIIIYMPYIHIYILCEKKKTCIHNIYIYTLTHLPYPTSPPQRHRPRCASCLAHGPTSPWPPEIPDWLHRENLVNPHLLGENLEKYCWKNHRNHRKS